MQALQEIQMTTLLLLERHISYLSNDARTKKSSAQVQTSSARRRTPH